MQKSIRGFLVLTALLCSLNIESNFAQAESPLTISEIMFRPSESNGEYVEIYNLSETETVDLSGYEINYNNGSSNDNLEPVSGGMDLSPGSYAIILEGDYNFTDGAYLELIPSDALILKIGDKSFGSSSSGMAGTSDRVINLKNTSGEVVDSYTYSADNPSGISDEKILMTRDNSPDNWANSEVFNGTPGKKNSVTPLVNDISIQNFTFSNRFGIDGVKITGSFDIKNNGLNPAEGYTIKVYNDINGDSTTQQEELYTEISSLPVDMDSSIHYEFDVFNYKLGENKFIVKVDYALDEKPEDNIASASFLGVQTNEERGDLIINEFMYTPESPEPEWIELFNSSLKTIDLFHYKISDRNDTNTVVNDHILLQPNEFFVIAKDSSIESIYNISSKYAIAYFAPLNNSGDRIMILDSLDRVIDSLDYSPTWGGNNGKSLERISPEDSSTSEINWKTSVNVFGATPGYKNSVAPKKYDLSVTKFEFTSPYVIDNDNGEIDVKIVNNGMETAQNYYMQIYKDLNSDNVPQQNEFLKDFDMPFPIIDSASYKIPIKNSLIDQGTNTLIGVLVYANDEDTTNNIITASVTKVKTNVKKNDIVINEIMYAPVSPETEWIEIYNRSNNQINLNGYKVADNATIRTIVSGSLVLNPQQYLVIASDSSIFSRYKDLSNVVIAEFPTLNNSGDRLMLIDTLGRIIDSLEYKSDWGGGNGKSLERYDVLASSTDSSNWKTSHAEIGATPGKINSISKKNYDAAAVSLIFNPAHPIAGDDVSISAEVSNTGRNDIDLVLTLYLIHKNGNKSELEISPTLNLKVGTTIKNVFNYKINSIEETQVLEVDLSSYADQDNSNDSIISTIHPGYNEHAVVINEIMFAPANGEPEWVEFYNPLSNNIDLDGWIISDVLPKPGADTLHDAVIKAKSYFVLSKDSSITLYHSNIPSDLLIDKFSPLNNDKDGIVIKDSWGSTIDSVSYDIGRSDGKSLERASVQIASIDKSNWDYSKDIELSTPGRINSISQKSFDLEVAELRLVPEFPSFHDEVSFESTIKNIGINNAENFSVDFYFINGKDTTLIYSNAYSELNSHDSITVETPKIEKLSGPTNVLCKISYPDDQYTSNNYFVQTFNAGYSKNDIQISEIMYDPAEGETEWIEIVNHSQNNINLNGWYVSDVVSPAKAMITNTDTFLHPGEFAVLARDTSAFYYYPPVNFFQTKFGTLGNTYDGIFITDYRGVVIDSVDYSSSWGGRNGISLERISYNMPGSDSANWTSSLSINKATPGIQNSCNKIIGYKYSTLVINEILYEPESGNSEFIEIYNTSEDSVQVGGMQLEVGLSKFFEVSSEFYLIPPKCFLVVAADSTIYNNYSWLRDGDNYVLINKELSLSNDGGLILLKDAIGTTLDSLVYSPIWQNQNIAETKNRSIERLNPKLSSNDPANWSSAVNAEGATPGKQNSIYLKNLPTEDKLTINPNPFSPDNDGFEDFTEINLNLTKPLSQVRIKVFDSVGRLVRTLAQNMPSGSRTSIIFDGLDDSGRPLRIGIYILLIEAVSDDGSTETIKAPIVIARKL